MADILATHRWIEPTSWCSTIFRAQTRWLAPQVERLPFDGALSIPVLPGGPGPCTYRVLLIANNYLPNMGIAGPQQNGWSGVVPNLLTLDVLLARCVRRGVSEQPGRRDFLP